MRPTQIIAMATAATVLALSACSQTSDLTRVSPYDVGVAAEAIPAHVVSARFVTIDAGDGRGATGAFIGAATGLNIGGSFGRSTPAAITSLGMALVGGTVGYLTADSTGRLQAQDLVIKTDSGKKEYRFVQPIFKQVGPLTEGTGGYLYIGPNVYRFLPEGF